MDLPGTVMVSCPWDTACARVRDALFKAFSQAPDTDAPETCLAALNAAFPGSGLALQAAGVLQYRALTDLDRQVLDEALHQLVMQLILQALDAQQPMMQYRPPGASPSSRPVMPRLLRALSWLSRQSLAVPIPAAVGSPGLRLVDCAALCRVLEDCLEAGTLEDGRQVFSFMEEAGLVEAILRESSSAAKLCALRSCNGLLRKLSKSQDLTLAGRILIFIARVHSLDDKSGVNLHSAVNSGLALPLDEGVGDGVDSSGEPIDARLYTTFWGLQTVFKVSRSWQQRSNG
ncbi:THO complex subunit 1 transcription elongation factor-domain-containing protein [Haematococcus lacustris]